MTNKYKIIVNTGKDDAKQSLDVVRGQGTTGQPLRIKAQAGAKYQIEEVGKANSAAPEYVRVKRVGKNLHLVFEDGSAADVIFEDYYDVIPSDYNAIVGATEDGSFYQYIPEDPKAGGLIPSLNEGTNFVSLALGGAEVVGAGFPIVALGLSPLLLASGLVAAGVLVAAQAANTPPAQPTMAVNDADGDGKINAAGTAVPGSVVTVTWPDGSTSTAPVDSNGNWSVESPTVQASGPVKAVVTDSNGNTSPEAVVPYVDTTPPVATVNVDTLTPDNLISAQEAGQETLPVTGTVSGEFTPGDVVSVSVNDKTFTGTVDAQGDFSIDVPTADLLADPDTKLQVSVLPTDAADNPGQPATDVLDYATAVLPPVNGALVLDPVAGDNIISLTEGALLQSTLSGSVTGPFTPGDVVTVNLNGQAITGTLNAQGAFSIPVSMAALKADPDHTVHVTVLAKDPVTGQTQALSNSQSYGVDVTGNPDTALTLDPITGDNLINASEAASLNTPVTGQVTGEFAAGDVVSVVVNNTTFTGGVNAQGQFSINVPTAQLLVDPDSTVEASVRATTATGPFTATAEQDYSVDTTQPAAPTITSANDPDADGKINASGTAEPGSVVTVTWPDSSTSTAPVDNNGNWSVESPTVQEEGLVSAVVKDVNGNPSSNASAQYVDNKPPAIAITAPVTQNPNGTLTITGTSEPGATVVVKDFNGVPIGSTTVNPNGTWTVTSTNRVPQGQLEATATDINGQQATATAPYVDTIPPVATLDVDNLTPDNLISAQEAGLETLPVTGTVSGEFTPGDVVSVSVNDKTFTGTVDAQGDFSVPVPTADLLADPDTKLQVSVLPTDAADNPGQPATDVLDYATAVLPPVNGALVLDPVAGDNIISLAEGAQPQSTLSGSVTGPFTPGDVVTVNLNGQAITGTLNAQGAFSILVSMAALKADPDHTVHVTVLAKDPVTGQTQALSNSQSYGVDVTGNPDTALTLDPITGDNLINASEAASLNTPVTGQVTGEFAAGDVVSIVVNNTTFTGGVNAQGEFSINVPTAQLLVDPDTQLQANVESLVTGQVTAMAELDYTVDTTPPAAPTITSANDPDADGKINASGTAEPETTVTVTWPDGTSSTAPVDGSGNWSVESPTVQEEGPVKAVATDDSGNVSDPATAQYVDNTPPAIAITSVTDPDGDGKINAVGTAEPESTVTVIWPDGSSSTAPVDGNGNWSVESPTTQTSGPVKVTATDLNDNPSPQVQAPYVDTIPPVATLDVDNLTPDNLISAQEAGLETLPVTGTVSGEFTPGDVVSVSVNDKTFTGTVDAQGDFSVDVPTADLLADPDTKLQVSVLPTDAADNPGQPATDVLDYATAVLPPVNGALVLDPVAGDNIISLAEGAQPQSTLSGSVTGPFTAGDVVTVNLNGQAITGTLNAQGAFSIPVSMAALKADPDHTVHVTVLAKDPVTGQTQALSNSQSYGVDVTGNPDTALTLDPITGDNLINASEAASLNTPVTGQVTGEFAAGDVVSVVVNNTTFTGGVNAQGEFSINVPTAQLLVDPDTQLQANVESLVTGQVTAMAELDYTVDTTPPAAPTITSANDPDADGKINASGTAEPETTVTVTWPDGTSSTAPVDGSGNWSVESPTVQEEGPVKAVATDDSGNVSDPATAQYVDNTPPAIAITSVTDPDGDGKINAVGTAEPESTVTVIWPDGSSSTATVDGNGNWSVESPTAQTSGPVKVTATDLNDNPSPQVQAPYVDTIPPVATLDVDNLTPDNLISAQEAGLETLPVTGTVSGEFTPGDVVSVMVNDKTFTGTVDAQGDFSVDVPTADLLADPDTKLQVSVLPTDAADNPGQPATDELDYATAVLPPVNGALVLDPVAGDNIISLAEGAQPQSTLSGSVTGPFTAGDVVTVNLNGQAITGTLNAQGAFSIPVSMAALKADPDHTVHVTVLAKDPVTGQTQALSNSQSYGVDVTGNPDTALTLDPITGDNLINASEAASLNTPVTGQVTGEFAAGDVVSVVVNNTTFTGGVNAQGEFSINVPTAQLLVDPDTQVEVSILATTPTGPVTATAEQDYTLDTTPPVATVNVDNLTPDNLISAQEAGLETLPVTGTVSGEFTPGDVVSVSVNDKTFTGTVDAQGDFSIDVPTADLLADPDTKLQVSVLPTDAADNPGQPATDVLDYATAVLPPVNGALVLDPVAGDNIISLAEGAQPQSTLSGSVTGPFTPGDVVTVNLNGQAITGTLNAQGAFSIPVSMAALKADPDHTVHVTVLAKDPVTGQTQALSNSQNYGVDVTGNPDTALTLDPITGDNLINASEAASPNTVIKGKVTGEFAAGDVVSVVVNNTTFTGGVNAQGEFSINVPTAQLLVDPDTQVEVSILATTPTGPVTATAEQDYTLDTTPPVATLDVDNLTPDNLISAQEAGLETLPVTGTVSGEFTPGDVVSVSVNDKTFTGTVDAQGDFSIDVPTADLLADPDTKLQVSVLPTDAADNLGQPATDVLDYATAVLPPVNGALVLDPVAGDNIISLAEGALLQSTLSGSVTGPFTPGDVVTVNLNGQAITGTLNAQGAFSIPVSMAALKADPDHTVHVTVLAKDPVTGQTQALSNSQNYGVDVTGNPDTALTLDPITGDNLINASEAASPNTLIKGKVTGEFAAGDVVSIVVNTTTFTGGVNAQGEFSINVLTAHLILDSDSTVVASVLATTPAGTFIASAEQDYTLNTTPTGFTVSIDVPVTQNPDGTITVTGTGEEGAIIEVTDVNGDPVGTATVLEGGTWSTTSEGPVPEGTLTATATDINDQEATDTAPYDDSTPPEVEIDEPITQNPDGTITVTGTGEEGAIIEVTDVNGDLVGTATVMEGGTWSTTSEGPVPEGTLTATATDINDQEATDTAPYDDSTPPEVEIDEPITQNPDGTITVTGTGEEGAIIEVTDVNGDPVGTATVLEGGTWSTTSEGPVPEGTLTATATDINDQEATDTAPYDDSTPPEVEIDEPITQNPDGTITVTGTGEEGAIIEVTDVNGDPVGTATVLEGGTWSTTSEGPVPEGTLTATATDINGQEATDTAPYDDSTPPEVEIDEPITQNPDGTITVTGTGEEGAIIEVTDVNGDPVGTATVLEGGTWSTTSEGPVPEGTLTATATDINDQEATDTAPYDDSTPPEVEIDEPITQNPDGTITVTGTGEEGAIIEVTDVNGDLVGTATVLEGGTWSTTSEGPVPEGTLTATATDINGETATDTAPYVDSTDPAIEIDSLTQNPDGTLTVSGTSEPGATVEVKDKDGVVIGTDTVDDDGDWSVTSSGAVPEGDVSAKATDINGQEATDTAVFSLSPALEVEIDEPITQNSDGTITVLGSGEEGADIEVTDVNGDLVGTATVLEGGTWTITSEGPVPEGTLTATATDINGETATDTAPYVDSTEPEVEIDEPITQNPDGTITVLGSGEEGADIEVTDVNGDLVGTATVLEGGTWTITSEGPVPEGTLTATATDINGETATDTAPYVDSTEPEVEIDEPITQNPDGTITVLGSGEEGADIEVTDVNGDLVGTATVLEDGTWSTTSEGPVPEGTLTATATDINGETATDTAPYVDSTEPEVEIDEPITQNTDGTITVSGSGEEGADIEVTDVNGDLVGTATVLEDGTWSTTSEGPVPEGTLTATATDINGETATDTAPYVDSTDPAIEIDSLTQNPDGTLTVSGTSEPGATVEVKDKDGVVIGTDTVDDDGDWSVTSSGAVPEGDVSAKATDINGQEATDTAVFSLSPALEVEIDEPITQNTDGTITVSGSGEEGADIEVTDVNGDLVGTATVLEDGTWSLVSEGEVPTGQLTATSINVNNQETSDTAAYDNKPIAILDEASGTEDSVTLTGDVSSNDTHKDGTESYALTSSATGSHGTLAFNADGTWTYTRTANLNAIQTAATETFTYSVTDAAGKTASADLEITLEPVNDAPAVSVVATFVPYTENQAPVLAKTGAFSLSDVDSTHLQSATVKVGTFSSPHTFVAGDVLSFTPPAGTSITGSYNNAGLLTLSGVATVAQYEEALNSVKYHSTRDDLNSGTRRVLWTVVDEDGLSSTTKTSGIGITSVNDAPVLPVGNYSLPTIEPITTELAPNGAIALEQFTGVGSFLSGVTDADAVGADKGIAIVGVNSAMGKLYLSVDGGVTWTSPVFEVNSDNAILLANAGNRRVYFRPHVGVEGEITDALTIRAWDRTNNLVESVVGQQVTGYAITAVGGTTPYSSHSANVSLMVASSASAPGFNGTVNDDDITGSLGADVILAKGGADRIKAGDGHDKIVINASNVQALAATNTAELDGEADINTLKLSGSDMFLDLTHVTVQVKINNFSVIDITGNGANTLKLNLDRVENLSGATDNTATSDVDESKMLVVQADAGDAVILENTLSWVAQSGLTGESLSNLYGVHYGFVSGHKYTQFSQNGATLFVDELAPVADIVGNSADDVLQGTASAEVIFGNGGADQISAGGGDDTVILNAQSVAALGQANTAHVDGGAGVNVLQITGVNVTLDLTTITLPDKLENFSVLDLSLGNGNTVKVSLQQVLDLSSGVADNTSTSGVDESKMLVVHGSGLNTLQLADSGDWTALTNQGGTSLQNTYGAQYGFEVGRSYTQYTNAAGSATLFVDQLLVQDLL